MKRFISFLLIVGTCLLSAGCSKFGAKNSAKEIEPQASQARAICELATMQCYYHNVAKYYEEDASGSLWWKKDRKFWIEYAGIVTIGIDTSLVSMEIKEDIVTITIPPTKVLGCKVDDKTLTQDSFIVAQDSAAVKAEHQTEAFKSAQEKMREAAENDTVLLANAQQRAQKLLEDYVQNIGDSIGKSYQIEWVYLDEDKASSEEEVFYTCQVCGGQYSEDFITQENGQIICNDCREKEAK